MFTVEEITFPHQKEEIITFLQKFNLTYENDIDYSIAVYQDGEIIATASKAKNVLKCFAVHKDFQGQGLTHTLIKNIEDRMFKEGIYHFFIYTPEKNKNVFRSVGYHEIITAYGISLLENGKQTIEYFLKQISQKLPSQKKACVVMNANPFTLGHRYLVERAAIENDLVIILVVNEDHSSFPFNVRLRLVKEGVKDLKNVFLHPTGPYLISNAVFPTYFLKKGTDVLKLQTKIDCQIFVNYFKKYLHIHKRYIGNEPNCEITKTYNEVMKKILPKHNIEVEEIQRKKQGYNIISASDVRKYLVDGQMDQIKKIVPDTTYEYLISEKAKPIIKKLKNNKSRH